MCDEYTTSAGPEQPDGRRARARLARVARGAGSRRRCAWLALTVASIALGQGDSPGAEQVWQQHRDVMAQYKPDVQLNSQTTYGWGVAQMIVRALQDAGRDLTPEGVAAAAENIKDWCCDLCFAPINLGPDDHRPSEVLFFMEARDGKWEFTGEYASVETTPGEQTVCPLAEELIPDLTEIPVRE